ncbi:MAG: hypothetical protein FWF75_04870 [Propionibacteriaceae bacterium]|nr:hypothetical protein [Propionibacteriaceae bacterium]
MASSQTGEKIGRRSIGWKWAGAATGMVITVALLAVLLQFDVMRRLFVEWHWLFIGIISVLLVVLLFGGMVVGGNIADRLTAAQTAAHPTPAALWARAHGWTYTLHMDRCEPELESSVGFSGHVEDTYDLVGGVCQGRQTWAFVANHDAFSSHMANSGELMPVTRWDSAVVMRLSRPWPGRLELGQSIDVHGSDVMRFGPYAVAAQVSEGAGVHALGPGEIGALLGGIGSSPAVAQPGLPVVFGVWDEAGGHVAVKVDWSRDPEQVLGIVLPTLVQLAGLLEADAQRRALPAQ